GCSLPILAKRCGLDPAIMAAPLITTIVDTCSIMIYFKIATIILKL
ncbi:MAG: magnesium transporter, partial [Oscillospiraceae bacterium]